MTSGTGWSSSLSPHQQTDSDTLCQKFSIKKSNPPVRFGSGIATYTMANTSDTSCQHQKSARAVRDGFTLVELMLTLAVLVTISAVAMVPISRWQKSMPLDQSVAILQQELVATRLMAIDQAARCSVTFDANSNSYIRLCTFARDDADVESLQLMPGVRFVVTNASQARSQQIWFQSDGTVSDSVVVLEDANGLRAAIKIERLTGMIRVADVATLAGVAGQ